MRLPQGLVGLREERARFSRSPGQTRLTSEGAETSIFGFQNQFIIKRWLGNHFFIFEPNFFVGVGLARLALGCVFRRFSNTVLHVFQPSRAWKSQTPYRRTQKGFQWYWISVGRCLANILQ